MSDSKIQSLKDKAAAFNITLQDKTIYTYVRDAQGNLVAENKTSTLYQPNIRYMSDEKKNTYLFVDLSENGERVNRVIQASIAKDDAPAGQVPIIETGKTESYDGSLIPTFTIAGKDAFVRVDPTGYSLRIMNERFINQNQKSVIPTSQKNEFGW
jgi:hypothetical protein